MSRPVFRQTRSSLSAFTILAACATQAVAQASFPTGTVRFVAPFSASTPPDIISRVIAKALTEDEGWRVIVENRPGGITTIAATEVLSQPPDGHSLYTMSTPSAAAPSLVPNISFDLDKDFEPVIKATVSYNVLVVNPSVPANTVAELVALLHAASITSADTADSVWPARCLYCIARFPGPSKALLWLLANFAEPRIRFTAISSSSMRIVKQSPIRTNVDASRPIQAITVS